MHKKSKKAVIKKAELLSNGFKERKNSLPSANASQSFPVSVRVTNCVSCPYSFLSVCLILIFCQKRISVKRNGGDFSPPFSLFSKQSASALFRFGRERGVERSFVIKQLLFPALKRGIESGFFENVRIRFHR